MLTQMYHCPLLFSKIGIRKNFWFHGFVGIPALQRSNSEIFQKIVEIAGHMYGAKAIVKSHSPF